MTTNKFDIGMIGLGVMGSNLALNMTDHGVRVAVYDHESEKMQSLVAASKEGAVFAAANVAELVNALQTPRSIMILVPAGPPVDLAIKDLLPHLTPGDLVIDGGNSYYQDTDLREKTLAEKGFAYMGLGISGGESGARHGPSLMPGGSPESYQRMRSIFEAIAAHVDATVCVAHLGPHSAGHYVKMVHNGIEYGLMQLIAEAYDLMKRGLCLSDDELQDVFSSWNQKELGSYLLEITANIFRESDLKTGNRLINEILDEAKQKGTGMWASEDAMNLQSPIPTIDIAVAMRNLSTFKEERKAASLFLRLPAEPIAESRERFLDHLKNALYASMIITFAQAMALLRKASLAYAYSIDLATVARTWRGGCIIRANLLDSICSAFDHQPDLPNLLMDPFLGNEILNRRKDLQSIACAAAKMRIPAPAMMVSLAYLDGYRSEWLPANLIQAQRDYFGAHRYERFDEKGVFHTRWEAE
jgi:6-phosphogluconate dehydrogenase